MSKRGIPGLKKRFRTNGAYEWHIDKRIKGFGRLCESTGTGDKEEAAKYLARRIEEIRQAAIYGTRPRRKFREVVDERRGQHPTHVFAWEDRQGRQRRFARLNNSCWKAARRRAAARYQQELGRPAPDGFRRVRIQDLKHTCGRRLRAAGVSLEDRQDILAHKTGRITTHYSAPEIGNLVAAVNRIANSRGIHARTVLRLVA